MALFRGRGDRSNRDEGFSSGPGNKPIERKSMTDHQSPPAEILVSGGSKHGATQEIAERIGTVLGERGHRVTVSPPEQVTRVSGFDAVVLGSAVYGSRWVDAAREVANMLAKSDPPIATWLFSSGPVGDPPKPEEGAVDVSAILEATSARDHHIFSGKIDRSTLSFGEKAIVVAVRAQEGDFRDWDEIEAWADQIADDLARESSDQLRMDAKGI
jgi:menaquinone-dependent protoporphyrinogen oxidase